MWHYIAPEMAQFEDSWHFSHAVQAAGLVFVTGVTGSVGDDVSDVSPRDQFTAAFEQLGHSLSAAGVGFTDLVDLTTYHVGLRQHLQVFREVKDDFVVAPYPAWTAIGVAELATPGTLVELKAVARAEDTPP